MAGGQKVGPLSGTYIVYPHVDPDNNAIGSDRIDFKTQVFVERHLLLVEDFQVIKKYFNRYSIQPLHLYS